jgi:predicted transposase YbfD/YdcC
MDAQATEGFLRFFLDLPDPRRHNVRHVFTDILTIAILAILCKSDDWIEVVEWARAQQNWLKTFLLLPHGIPGDDTFRRVFARIDPVAFERCFINWTKALAASMEGKLIALDGKTLRRSFDHAWSKQQALHLVSAWCGENQLLLGQLAVESKSNEITAIPLLLDLLAIKGAIITIDAIGCQREIAGKIREKGGDYLLAVKENQPSLYEKVKVLAREMVLEQSQGSSEMRYDFVSGSEQGHGRIETRKVWVSDEVNWLGDELLNLWPDLASIVRVESTRQNLGDLTGKISTEQRYYISSIKGCDAKKMARAVRGHWGVENQLHWRLDMSFREDESRLRKGHGAQNFSRLRRIVINQLKNDPRKVSLKVKRYRCSIDRDYLLERLKQ